MAVVWRLGLVLFGFALATLVAALSYVPTASAQERPLRPSLGAEQPAASERQPQQQPPPSSIRSIDPLDDHPLAPYETPPRRALRGSQDDDSGESLDDAADGDADAESDGPPSRTTGRPDDDGTPGTPGTAGGIDSAAALDGATPEDGIVDSGDTEFVEDGGDPMQDTRPPADIEVFENPPAGHGPLLFQIEDIDSVVTDRRPERLARFEPYDPIGIRIGSFVLFPETELSGRHTNNALSSPAARSDIAAEIRSTMRLVSNWSIHALELTGTTFTSWYDEFPSENDRAWSAEARGRLDITRRTNLQGMVGHSVSQESRSAIDASEAGPRPDVTVDQAELAFNHRFNRLSVRLRGAISDTTYSDTDGVSNSDRDTLETREAVRATWEFKPTFSVFAEQELNQRDKGAAGADGVRHDSTGTRSRVGVDFGGTGAVLRGEASVGYGRQSPDDRRLSAVDAFLFDANLAWRPTEITSLLFTASSDIVDTTSEGSGGVVSHQVGIEARHAFRRHIIASAGLSYTLSDYDSIPLEERTLLAFLNAEYYASPWLVLFARYEHLSFASNEANGDYASDEFRLGVRLRR